MTLLRSRSRSSSRTSPQALVASRSSASTTSIELDGPCRASADVNGDGLADVLLTARLNESDGNAANGAAYLVFGKADGSTVDLADVAAGQGGYKILGEDDFDFAGESVSGIGDINGDAIPDFVVGATGNSTKDLTVNGAAYVVYGKAGGGVIDLDSVAVASGGFKIFGDNDRDLAGFSVSGAGDVNGDGRPISC